MHKTVKALILREVRYKEADRILNVLSEEGKLILKAPGALKKNSKTAAGTQALVYSELTLYESLGKWNVKEAVSLEDFKGLREDITALSLGSYFAEALEVFSQEDIPDSGLLRLGLNSLYALSNGLYSQEHIKAAFEMRCMCLNGYMPDIGKCVYCGKEEPESPFFSYENGKICCRRCRDAAFGLYADACSESLAALRYICGAPDKTFLKFSISEEAQARLSNICERWFLYNTDKNFPTLEYWKKIKI